MQAQTTAPASPASEPAVVYHPAWNSLPTLIWALVLALTLVVYRRELRELLQLLNRRLRLGATVKLGAVEIGGAYVRPDGAVSGGFVGAVREDADRRRHAQREQYYLPNRQIMLVHKIVPSETPGQAYDILIYVVPHPTSNATLVEVKRIEYYFGKSWGRKVFTSTDRARGFAVATSAYGPFMCTAEIHFSDGEPVMVSRYIDFEMGALGPAHERPEGTPRQTAST